jgi:hypothetical protein
VRTLLHITSVQAGQSPVISRYNDARSSRGHGQICGPCLSMGPDVYVWASHYVSNQLWQYHHAIRHSTDNVLTSNYLVTFKRNTISCISGTHSRQGKIFLFSTASRPALGLTQPSTQRVPGAISQSVKWPGIKLTTHLYLVPRSRIMELYLHSPLRRYGIVLN